MSCVDVKTPFAMDSSELEIINEIKTAAESFTLWFQNDCMKVSPEKFLFLFNDKKINQVESGGWYL